MFNQDKAQTHKGAMGYLRDLDNQFFDYAAYSPLLAPTAFYLF